VLTKSGIVHSTDDERRIWGAVFMTGKIFGAENYPEQACRRKQKVLRKSLKINCEKLSTIKALFLWINRKSQ